MIRSVLFLSITFLLTVWVNAALAQCGTTPVAGDLIISSNTTLSGTYNVTGLFHVQAGVTVTVESFANNGCGELVVNANEVIIEGIIDADGAGHLGGVGGTPGTGGNNTDALVGCVDKDNCLVIDTDPGLSGADGTGPGAGLSGTDATAGRGPKQQCNNIGDSYGFVSGAGGAGGGGGGSYGGAGNSGDIGGGGAAYNAGTFSNMDLSTCTTPLAGNGGTGGGVGSIYGTATGNDIDLGSGGAGAGGGGKSAGNGIVGGSGGNGGGLVVLNSTGSMQVLGTVSASGSLGMAGGSGGNGGITTDCCEDGCNDCGERTFSSGAGGGAGGGGGSGGGIMITANGLATITGTLRVEGGNGGTGGNGGSVPTACNYSGGIFCGTNGGSASPGTAGNLGGAGSGGRVKIFKVPCLANTVSPSLLIGGGNGAGGQADDGTSNIADIAGIVAPSVTVSADSVSCFGIADGVATAVVTGGAYPFTYSWSPSGGTDSIATGLVAGIYTVTVTDDNGCQDSENVVVSQPDTLTIATFGILDSDCFGANTGEASAMAFGGTTPYMYSWNDPMAQIGATAQNLPAGTWTVTVTDANGCTADSSVTIDEPLPFNATIGVDQQVSCFGGNDGQATVVVGNGVPGTTYLWDDPAAQSTATASGLTAGNYTVTVSNSPTCDTILSVVITEPDELVLIAVENTAVACNGDSTGVALVTQVGGTPGYTYQWNDPDLQTTDAAVGLPAGTYEVIVTDANSCTTTASVEITEPSPFSIVVDVDSVSCNGGDDGSILAMVTGGTSPYTYLWDDPLAQTTGTATGLSAGTYSVEVTDDNGCVESFTGIIVQEPTAMNVTLDPVNNVSCFGLNDGNIIANATGGTPGYTFLWDDPLGQTTSVATGLSPGLYTVTATDAAGCEFTTQITELLQPDSLQLSTISVNPVTCDGGEDGTASVSAIGGTVPYNYLWNDTNAQTTSAATGLVEGQYQVLVTDENGCTDSTVVEIGAPLDPLVADFTIDPDTGLQPLEITLFNQSSGGTFYTWQMGDGEEVFREDTLPFTYLYQDSGNLHITLIAFNEITGCHDTITYENLYIIPTSLLDIPTVFTPNGDGYNDVFLPEVRNLIDFSATIYNRWGEKVFEWARPRGGWDGRTLAGIELPAGTYFYVIRGVGIDDDRETDYEFNGSVTLIR